MRWSFVSLICKDTQWRNNNKASFLDSLVEESILIGIGMEESKRCFLWLQVTLEKGSVDLGSRVMIRSYGLYGGTR